jgi:hypothetical protein
MARKSKARVGDELTDTEIIISATDQSLIAWMSKNNTAGSVFKPWYAYKIRTLHL